MSMLPVEVGHVSVWFRGKGEVGGGGGSGVGRA